MNPSSLWLHDFKIIGQDESVYFVDLNKCMSIMQDGSVHLVSLTGLSHLIRMILSTWDELVHFIYSLKY